jgi:hypothetical protein
MEFYFLSEIKNNPNIEINTFWQRCGYSNHSQHAADTSEEYERYRYFLSPLVIRCSKCLKYRNDYVCKSQARPDDKRVNIQMFVLC